MKFLVEIEVTANSMWPDGSQSLLAYLQRIDEPEKIVRRLLWNRIGGPPPAVVIGHITQLFNE